MSRPYWWFKGKSVNDLIDQLVAAGPRARLEVHLEGQHMTFRVVPPAGEETATATEHPPVNDSHVCPPDCP